MCLAKLRGTGEPPSKSGNAPTSGIAHLRAVPDEDAGAAQKCELKEVSKDAGSPRAEPDDIGPTGQICNKPDNEVHADEPKEDSVIMP